MESSKTCAGSFDHQELRFRRLDLSAVPKPLGDLAPVCPDDIWQHRQNGRVTLRARELNNKEWQSTVQKKRDKHMVSRRIIKVPAPLTTHEREAPQ